MTRETKSVHRKVKTHQAWDSDNIILQSMAISSFMMIAYCLLSFNENFQFFIYYNHTLLCISSVIFIITATFCNIIIPIEEISNYKPHPLFWRFIIVLGFWYTLFLMVLIVQPNLNDIRNIFKIFDSTLNTPIETRSYATDCWNFSYAVIADKFDRFVWVHIATWFIAALCGRHRCILWFCQILWELIEIITCYFVPNFGECWWDQVILDIFLCNGIGLELGLYVVNKINFDPPIYEISYIFSWQNVRFKTLKFLGFNVSDNERCLFGKAKYMKPKKKKYFEDFQWIVEYFWALFAVPGQISIGITMNAFLLKLWLWIPTEHILNPIRLSFLMISLLGCRDEFYYGSILKGRGIETKTWSGKIYTFSKICYFYLFMIFLEYIVVYRAIPIDDFPKMPHYNKCWLIAVLSVFVIYSFILCRAY